ncbi:MAG: hypothetical protein ACI4JK_03350 [Oscillospiraceae bacterium]
MRIIKKGVKPEQVARFECDVCGTIFEENTDQCGYAVRGIYNELKLYKCRCPICDNDVLEKSDKVEKKQVKSLYYAVRGK